MKTLTPELKAHLRQEVTTLCSCLAVTRQDGRSFYFTDHDRPVLYQGQLFVPYNSFARTSVSTTIELEVDSLEVNGILNSGAVLRDDVNGGLFDFARVEMFLLNWADVGMGRLLLRRGWIGEINMNEDETFQAEVRGLTQVLAYRVGEPYTPTCRADLGDALCKVKLVSQRRQPDTAYQIDDCVLGMTATAVDYFTIGLANPDFESDVINTVYTAPTGWTAYGQSGSRWRVVGTYHDTDDEITLPFKTGSQFIVQTQADPAKTQEAGLYQDFDLISHGMTADDLDTGLCRLTCQVWVACPGDKSSARARAFCYDGAGASLGSIWDTQVVRYSRDNWNLLRVQDALLPAGTRKVRIDLYGQKDLDEADGAAFDGFSGVINQPDGTAETHMVYGGIRLRCTTAGVTGGAEPAFTSTLAATYTDGTVVWTAEASLESVGAVLAPDTNQKAFTFATDKPDGYFDAGLLTWATGANAGRTMEVKTCAGGVLTLFQRVFYPIVAGDQFVVRPGCDKRRTTCLNTFDNVINMRAEPDVPGQDQYYKTPDADQP